MGQTLPAVPSESARPATVQQLQGNNTETAHTALPCTAIIAIEDLQPFTLPHDSSFLTS
jgi:hypothetical protein